jgi:hypothetical protein
MFIKRLHHVPSCANDAQVHSIATGFARELFGGGDQLSAEASSLSRRRDAEQAEIRTITALFHVNAAGGGSVFFVHKKISGAQVVQHAFAVHAVAINRDALDNEGFVDELLERFGIGNFCNTNRRESSFEKLTKKSNGPEILRWGRVLLRCAEADCISRCGRCAMRSRF